MIMNNLIMHIKDHRKTEVSFKILEDLTMKMLAEVIATNWPRDKRLFSDFLKPFFDNRESKRSTDTNRTTSS